MRRRVHRFSGLTGLVALLVLAGSCTGDPPPAFPARVEPTPATVATVLVERRDVTTVVALDAVVTAGAEYVEVAPSTGVVEFPATAAKPGTPIRAGALLAVVGDREVRTRFAAFVVSRLVPSKSTVTARRRHTVGSGAQHCRRPVPWRAGDPESLAGHADRITG